MKKCINFWVVFLILGVGTAVAQSSNGDQNRLEAKVRSFYKANQKVLTGQTIDAALAGDANADDIRNGGQGELNRSRNVSQQLAAQNIRYTQGNIKNITFNSVEINGNSATVEATASYDMKFPSDVAGAPERAEYDENRLFTFEKQGNNRWVLVNQEMRVTAGVFNTVAPNEDATLQDLPGVEGSSSTKVTGKNPNPRDRGNGNGGGNKGGYVSTTTDVAPQGSYNATAAANYARQYAYSYNSSYRSYSNDCTNFISQCLKTGGWTDASGSGRTSNNAWYYSSLGAWNTSYTWAGAENHYWFHSVSGRSWKGDYISDAWLGDVLHVDFDGGGHIDHTVIVSKEDSNGNDYVSYHTTNTRDKPMSQFISDCGSSAKFYLWLLKTSY